MAEFIEGVGKEFRIKGDRRSLKYGEERGSSGYGAQEFKKWGRGRRSSIEGR